MHLAPSADESNDTRHFTALDIAGHDIVHAAEPRLGQSSSVHRLFPPFRFICIVLLVIGSTSIAPFGIPTLQAQTRDCRLGLSTTRSSDPRRGKSPVRLSPSRLHGRTRIARHA